MAAEKKTDKKYVETPLMKQYYAIKAVHPDAVLLFRVGDFYETFGEDAIKASGILGITLTRRANGSASYVELAGFPYHAVDTYLPKLVRAGERVAICEQLEDPKTVKGLVKRGVIELVTPGIVMGDNILSNKENTYLASVYFGTRETGVAFLDISTGEFYVAEGSDTYVDKLISNLAPKEVIFQRGYEDRFADAFGSRLYTYRLDEWVFSQDVDREKLCRQFGTSSLKGFGIDHFTSGISAAGAILHYLEFTEHRDIAHIRSIARIDQDDYVWIDKFTIRNLELFASNGARGKGSFAEVIDRTLSPMGGRLLKRWIAMPVKSPALIDRRLDVVEYFTQHAECFETVRSQVTLVGDLERIASRIAAAKVTPRELVQLKNSLSAIETLKSVLASADSRRLQEMAGQLDTLAEVRDRIAREIYPDPLNNQIQRGGVIADGVDPELDDLRRIALHGKDYLAQLQQRESEATGIPSLRLSYNNVFGYYIEVRNTHKDKVPETWIRKQTLANAERYITEELKVYEEKILGAEEKMLALELRIYNELMAFIRTALKVLQQNASVIARLDCLQSFARIACERHYVRPVLDEGKRIEIRQGRHPVIETTLSVGEEYIPNDIMLDDQEQQIVMITGPNMSGKSALLRQTALIILMAQMGSFVRAESAHIGVVVKIFT
ncbi:MAG: DNA mismatch repair protein MutS, partial [Alistipes sp.]|nr:DNA mismatch repair protein MutS [Alistipes sp.]